MNIYDVNNNIGKEVRVSMGTFDGEAVHVIGTINDFQSRFNWTLITVTSHNHPEGAKFPVGGVMWVETANIEIPEPETVKDLQEGQTVRVALTGVVGVTGIKSIFIDAQPVGLVAEIELTNGVRWVGPANLSLFDKRCPFRPC